MDLLNYFKVLYKGDSKVLMYHRIASPELDIWRINVNPRNFEDQLIELKKKWNVIALFELVDNLNAKRQIKNSLAITFDDGYMDNFTIAKPLLEKYNLPATFFISSVNIDTKNEYWWDELENLILFSRQLPSKFVMKIGQIEIKIELFSETILTDSIKQKHKKWDACYKKPPTARAALFYSLWQQLKPLEHKMQQYFLTKIREWANVPLVNRNDYKIMSIEQIKELSENKLFTIGAHTETHSALIFHDELFQQKELYENKKYLQEITGQEIDLLAYPYGDYNENTTKLASELGFKAAFTTEAKRIGFGNNNFKMGRFQVNNFTKKFY